MLRRLRRLVPYYHHRLEPEYFTGKGWRGWFVLILNYLAYRLRRYCDYRVMLLIARAQGLDKATVYALKTRWGEENAEESKLRSVFAPFGQAGVTLGPPKHRYEEGRKNGAWPEDAKAGTDQMSEQRFQRLLADRRQHSYTYGRADNVVYEVDAEPVPPTEG